MEQWIVMGICETGEHMRFCEQTFRDPEAAQDWIYRNEDQYPESQLYIVERDGLYR